MLPTPKEVIKQLNQMIFKFLWNGTDKVTQVSTINEYLEGGLKMIDLECMVKSLRLAWLERIFIIMMEYGRDIWDTIYDPWVVCSS